jgi:hypothetical protein
MPCAQEPVNFDWKRWRTTPVEVATSKSAGDEHVADPRTNVVCIQAWKSCDTDRR